MCMCCSTCRSPVRSAPSSSHLGTLPQLHYSASAPPRALVSPIRGLPHNHLEKLLCCQVSNVPSMQEAMADVLRFSKAF